MRHVPSNVHASGGSVHVMLPAVGKHSLHRSKRGAAMVLHFSSSGLSPECVCLLLRSNLAVSVGGGGCILMIDEIKQEAR
jgi:hypothetical protein